MPVRISLLVLLAVVAASCRGSSSETPSNPPPPATQATSADESTPHVVSDADAAATSSARFREFRDSAEYQAAMAAAESCLTDAGYQRQPDGGVVLKDGTTFKPGPGGQAVRGAYLEYRIDLERCSEESGVYDLAARSGYQLRPQISPSDLASMNAQTISMVHCMKDKGWDVPDPRTLHGMLVLDAPEMGSEEEAAWFEDQSACYADAR